MLQAADTGNKQKHDDFLMALIISLFGSLIEREFNILIQDKCKIFKIAQDITK